MTELSVAIYDNNPELFVERDRLVTEAFPEFAMHSAIIEEYFWALYEAYPEYQFCLHNNGKLIAIGNCMPSRFDGPLSSLPAGGVEWGLQTAAEHSSHSRAPSAPGQPIAPGSLADDGREFSPPDKRRGQNGCRSNLLVAFQIVIDHSARNQGVSYQAIKAMVDIARRHDLDALVAPVRPNRKCNYPDMPMDEYIAWKREDGLPFDDWLRVHVRLGAEILGVCSRSFVVDGSVADWERWTGQRFEKSGEHIVEGALNPVRFDLEADRGIYVEPNVWVVHRV